MFWSNLENLQNKVAAVSSELAVTYAELASKCDELIGSLGTNKKLIFVFVSNDLNGLVAYLACIRAGHVALLIDPKLAESKVQRLRDEFHPHAAIEQGRLVHYHDQAYPLDARLAVLLPTSGSTGSAKYVALSYQNLQSNAEAICQYLPIRPDDKTVSTLPLFYSYGLSVINSHLSCGSTIHFTQFSFMNREFWEMFKQQRISSFASVPHGYNMLLRLNFTDMQLPDLRYFTQAGGKLAVKKVSLLADYAKRNRKQFYVMYGQTEATARMAYLKPSDVLTYPDSIGEAIPGGALELRDDCGEVISTPNTSGELVYQGPNVMLGYVQSNQNLIEFSPLNQLFTGDIGHVNNEGLYFIDGRTKRIVKLFGNRVSLDDLEEYCYRQGYEVFCVGEDDKLMVAAQHTTDQHALKSLLSQHLALHSSIINIVLMPSLPFTASGKKNYNAVQAYAEGQDAG